MGLKVKAASLLIVLICFHTTGFCDSPIPTRIVRVLKKKIMENATFALTQKPVTVTGQQSTRSAGGIHDFYSEGDYWWPDPNNLSGPYIQKDGLTNPDNFVAHRKAMIRFSQLVGSLTSAYIITKEVRYAAHAINHLKAWFIDTATLMNPSLLYAQAIKGRATGRGIGIIDMIQMIEVAQSVQILEKFALIEDDDLSKIKKWFSAYLKWVTSHPYGIAEREAKNNHGTCWVMQVAVFAKLTGNDELINYCRERFKNTLLPNQMDSLGSFPLELRRTKPYGYSLFNLDAMTTIGAILSDRKESLWAFRLADGRSLKKGIEFMYPFVANKEQWPYPPDVMFFGDWPVAHPFLLFGSENYKNKKWYRAWKRLEHFPEEDEIVRNLPVRNPLIWLAGYTL